jgi:uncharacterized protein YjbI with pentapeptide repeats
MANQEHLDILAKGVEAWNAWREQQPDSRPDLTGADLRDAHLSGAYLRYASLSYAHLNGADLNGADLFAADLFNTELRDADLFNTELRDADLFNTELRDAHLSSADLSGAALYGADLRDAHLSNAKLSSANLSGADLHRAILSGADLGGAACGGTDFVDVDLSEVLGLDDTRHKGPSYIDIETIYRSKGKIPESFLRGCGVPENFITYMHSLTGAAFEFYSCFISYSTTDQEFADRLYADLQAKGVRCWFAPHDIQGGKKVHEQIDEAIKIYDKLLLILSDASMNSPWVKTEIANARAREQQQKRQMLFPITLVPFERIKGWRLFDADTGIDSAREIREYFIPDFTNWKDHDQYSRVFELLVRDLKTPAEANTKPLAAE